MGIHFVEIMIFLCILLFVFSDADILADLPYDVRDINFDPLRKKIREVLARTSHVPELTEHTTIHDCAMPKSAVMLSHSTHYFTDFMTLRQHGMHSFRHFGDCLKTRFISVCLDAKCFHHCEDATGNCVLLDLPKLPNSEYGEGAYDFITYLPHEIIFSALKEVEEIILVDGDVLMMQNPWVATRHKRREDGQHYRYQMFDFMYQPEHDPADLSCALGMVNTGQMYIRNSSKVEKYMSIMRQHKNEIVNGKDLSFILQLLPVLIVLFAYENDLNRNYK